MSGPLARRLAALGVVGAVAVAAAVVSTNRVRTQLDALAACEAVETGDYARALAASEGFATDDETGRSVAECRCFALLATDRGDECTALLETTLSDGWTPGPALAIHLVQTWRDAGRARDAAELARRAARRHPTDPDLFYLELVTRGAVEDERTLLEELATRLPDAGVSAARMRATLAERHLLRGEASRALDVLGAEPPTDAGDALSRWFETRAAAAAFSGDLDGVRRTMAAWRGAGASPDELRAHYALTLSIAGLADPDHSPIELLRAALKSGAALPPALEERLRIRLVLTLVNASRQEEALALYDESRTRFELAGLARSELERSAAHERLAALPTAERSGAIHFRIDAPSPGQTLLLSPEPDAEPDEAYELLPVPADGRVAARRRVGIAPQRWVLRDGAGSTRASGSVSPVAGGRVDVAIETGPPREPARATLARQPADGRRRVFVLLLDCADWRITQYLRSRGELPVTDALLGSGYRAVLDSDPPLTAAALESLVWPQRRSGESVVGLVHQLGVELAGLSDVGDNPFGGLAWLLPESEDLFSTIGRGPLTAANLLFAHGGHRGGRHSEVSGPGGERRRIRLGTSARDLSAKERAAFPALAAVQRESDAVHLRTIAAELDAAEQAVGDGALDLLMLRVEPLDILTHAHFVDAVRDGQDDGAGLLFSVYRYLDARLGNVHALLDADDVFVVMSDHGIRTAMEHSRDAIFVASGAGVPHGRADGRPALRGVPAVLATLLGVSTDWPDTGVAPWAGALAGR